MTLFYTDFSEYTVDEFPGDWSAPWGAGSGATGEWHVTDGITEYWGTKSFMYNDVDQIASKKLCAIWDDIGTVTDCECLGLFLIGVPGSNYQAMTLIRESGAGPFGQNSYFSGLYDGDLYVGWINGGTYSGKDGDATTNYLEGDWVYIRTRMDGYRIRAKSWKYGESEPGSWMADWTDGDSTWANGAVGLNGRDVDYYCDWFGCDDTGDTVPMPDAVPSDATQPVVFVITS